MNFSGNTPTPAYETNMSVIAANAASSTHIVVSVVSSGATIVPSPVNIRPLYGQQFPRFA